MMRSAELDPLVGFVFDEAERQGRFHLHLEREAGLGKRTLAAWRYQRNIPTLSTIRAALAALGYELAAVPKERGPSSAPQVYRVGWLELNPETREVHGGPYRRRIELSKGQFEFLAHLMRRPGVTRTHDELADAMGSEECDPANLCATLACQVRHKVRQFAHIESEYGIGYRIVRAPA